MCEDLERSVEVIGIKFKSPRSPSSLEISGDVEISGDFEMCEDLERSVEMIGIKFKSLRSPINLEISGDLEM